MRWRTRYCSAMHVGASVEDLWLGRGDHPELLPRPARHRLEAVSTFPLGEALTSAPVDSDFVTAVVWRAGRGGPRREGYFLAPSPLPRYAWVLWDFSYDRDWDVWSCRARAAMRARLSDREAAARYMLAQTWACEHRRHATGLFDAIEADGILRAQDVWRVAALVWPQTDRAALSPIQGLDTLSNVSR